MTKAGNLNIIDSIINNTMTVQTIPKTVTISTLKQKSQMVLNELNEQSEAFILTQDGLPVAILLPAKGSVVEAERLKLVKKDQVGLDKALQKTWGEQNKNIHFSSKEIDQYSF